MLAYAKIATKALETPCHAFNRTSPFAAYVSLVPVQHQCGSSLWDLDS